MNRGTTLKISQTQYFLIQFKNIRFRQVINEPLSQQQVFIFMKISTKRNAGINQPSIKGIISLNLILKTKFIGTKQRQKMITNSWIRSHKNLYVLEGENTGMHEQRQFTFQLIQLWLNKLLKQYKIVFLVAFIKFSCFQMPLLVSFIKLLSLIRLQANSFSTFYLLDYKEFTHFKAISFSFIINGKLVQSATLSFPSQIQVQLQQSFLKISQP
ncbi:transmembrane protein, putative (macronuclear) [Tetrahymena thermophila SB210]|uniref:Transmembrane protein, putative n=1 Tax=Tetrahymena thermophila (strain SB210) TaxID=312017 RepID=W7WZS2_TETTS|nr:transmembrane protein, putative [Tetrahymena thermophila SB210]EWS71102.1 transmembrane protein, putative [Tetrahymena thermophila SB210]|eukprot:XP_012656345.1 transmembrane protein, putative [Tetrahymena thermophila SB210]